MALDKEYFDSIELEVAKKKYYNAKKVDAVLADIRREAEALTAENERMRRAISALADRRVELGDAMLSAQGVYRGVVEKANARAEQIVAEAEKRAADILREAQRQQEDGIQRTERLFNKMKRQHQSAIEALNSEWQAYLCGLYPADGMDDGDSPAEPGPSDRGEFDQPDFELESRDPGQDETGEAAFTEEAPGDLGDKVDAIARQLFAINDES